MAYQGNKPAPARINRTPAPDEVTNIRHPSAAGPGMNGPQASSVAPGQASESVLAQNLRQSSDPQDLIGQVIRNGVSGRDDRIPVNAAETDWQRRPVSDDAYPTSYGLSKRGPSTGSPGSTVPPKTGWNPGVQVRQPK